MPMKWHFRVIGLPSASVFQGPVLFPSASRPRQLVDTPTLNHLNTRKISLNAVFCAEKTAYGRSVDETDGGRENRSDGGQTDGVMGKTAIGMLVNATRMTIGRRVRQWTRI